MAKRYDPIMCMFVDEPTKAQDVAPATQRYINTIVDESKSNAEKFVRQAEQDDEVPENELKYVYKAYNEKFGYKFHDSASTLDKAISTCDAASGDVMKQIVSTAKAWAKQYNQLFEKAATAEEVKKLKSHKDNDYRRAMDNLDKIYNEVSQAYGRARSEVRDLFDEVDSNGFKAYQRVTQK